MYFAHVPLKDEHEDFLYSWRTSHVSVSSISQTWISNEALETVKIPNMSNIFILIQFFTVEHSNGVKQRDHLLHEVMTVIGNSM